MTALILNWIASHDAPGVEHNHHQGPLTMKAVMLAMMCLAAGGAHIMEFIPDGKLDYQQQFFFGLIAGTIGTLVGLSLFDCPTVKALARQGVTNLGLATVLGPTVAAMFSKTTGIETTIVVLAPISLTLGIGGSVLFAQIWPMFVAEMAKRAKKEIRAMVGDDSDG
ncbi:MAG: hypothetical protein EBR82_51830 [Caulobacteraceae bacterium]|nr:hypothetical protein [Caulobacteraceae bacterium]